MFKLRIEKLKHYLFECPTFWSIRPQFQCPICHKKYRCYWNGNDIEGVGINICNKCARVVNWQIKNSKEYGLNKQA